MRLEGRKSKKKDNRLGFIQNAITSSYNLEIQQTKALYEANN